MMSLTVIVYHAMWGSKWKELSVCRMKMLLMIQTVLIGLMVNAHNAPLVPILDPTEDASW